MFSRLLVFDQLVFNSVYLLAKPFLLTFGAWSLLVLDPVWMYTCMCLCMFVIVVSERLCTWVILGSSERVSGCIRACARLQACRTHADVHIQYVFPQSSSFIISFTVIQLGRMRGKTINITLTQEITGSDVLVYQWIPSIPQDSQM